MSCPHHTVDVYGCPLCAHNLPSEGSYIPGTYRVVDGQLVRVLPGSPPFELQAEVARLSAENERLRANVDKWERKEVDRASCCYANEVRADAAEARCKEEQERGDAKHNRLVAATRRIEELETRLLEECTEHDAEYRMREGSDIAVSQLTRRCRELEGVLREVFPFVDPNATAVVDELARRFYRDTGLMAPGKSVPLEMANSQPDDDERLSKYREWLQVHRTTFADAIGRALAEPGDTGVER